MADCAQALARMNVSLRKKWIANDKLTDFLADRAQTAAHFSVETVFRLARLT
jgi:hypothetical protein